MKPKSPMLHKTTALIAISLLTLANLAHSQSTSRKTDKSPFSTKKGIGITLRDPIKQAKKGGSYITNMPKVEKLNLGWNYSWGTKLAPNQVKKSSFAPMLFSIYGKPDKKQVAQRLKKTIAPTQKRQKKTVLLAFNEPDKKSQGNLSVKKAISYWKSLEALNVPLCSPSCVHPQNDWMVEFMREIDKNNLRVDYIGVHDYGGGNAEAFKKKLRKVYLAYGKRPLIITEFAVADWHTPSIEKKPSLTRKSPQIHERNPPLDGSTRLDRRLRMVPLQPILKSRHQLRPLRQKRQPNQTRQILRKPQIKIKTPLTKHKQLKELLPSFNRHEQ